METNLERCLKEARVSGAPLDLVKHFLNHKYVPLPWQWRFHAAAREADLDNGPVDIGTGGARGPGKSHAVLSQAGLDDCQRVLGLKGLFLRQTGIAAQESFDDLVDKTLRGKVEYKRAGNLLKFPNGSRIVLGGFKDQRDIDKYIGIEYDFIIVEELNQLTEDKYTKLRGSLRTSKPNWRPRMYTSFNPGGIGHAFVKGRYITPLRLGKQTDTRFIGSTYLSNPYLNKEYTEYLEGLTGDLGKAWREGEWDIFAGQFFSVWRERLHVCRPFVPSKNSVIVGGLDWGRVDNFSFHLSEVSRVDYDGSHFYRSKVFFEVYGTETTPDEWSNKIKIKLKGYGLTLKDISWVRADTQIFSKMLDAKALDIYSQFVASDELWRNLLKPANKDRVGGWENLQRWLSVAPDGVPYLQYSSECPNAIRVIPELIHDENKVEDVNQKGENDAADSGRYLHMSLKWIGGRIGAVNSQKKGDKINKMTAQFIGDKQVGINLDAWENPTKITKSGVGGIIRR